MVRSSSPRAATEVFIHQEESALFLASLSENFFVEITSVNSFTYMDYAMSAISWDSVRKHQQVPILARLLNQETDVGIAVPP